MENLPSNVPTPSGGLFGRLLGRRLRAPAPQGIPPAAPRELSETLSSKLDVLQTQLNYVETLLEGLQDAVHRRSALEDKRNEELMRRIEPARIARDIANDARRRGV
jgi:hypothetical protein